MTELKLIRLDDGSAAVAGDAEHLRIALAFALRDVRRFETDEAMPIAERQIAAAMKPEVMKICTCLREEIERRKADRATYKELTGGHGHG